MIDVSMYSHQWSITFLIKKSRDTITYTGAESISEDQKLAKELHKPIARKFQWPKLYLSYQNSIWDADLANMELISKYNKRAKFLLCVINIYSKCAWVVPLRDKKGITITDAFQTIWL